MAIVITGAAGFIGSCLLSFLNEKGLEDLYLVDDFSKLSKQSNWKGKRYEKLIDRADFESLKQIDIVDFVFHMGARTDTSEMDVAVFNKLNLNYSKDIWNWCTEANIPLIYASSAATYGDGKQGFGDEQASMQHLKALNPYGQSKLDFDLWATEQEAQPPFWCGLKFFNVFGPNEYHKGRMASVVYHAFKQIEQSGTLKLFQSHRPEFEHGEQKRDFIYVKDLLELMWFWYQHASDSGVYNAGTGQARSFLDLAEAIFSAMNLPSKIEFIPTPEDIRESYQYYTQADMKQTRDAGFQRPFSSLEESVKDYIQHYLMADKIL